MFRGNGVDVESEAMTADTMRSTDEMTGGMEEKRCDLPIEVQGKRQRIQRVPGEDRRAFGGNRPRRLAGQIVENFAHRGCDRQRCSECQ